MSISEQEFKVIGLMSGTSMDGLDIAYVSFKENDKIHFKLECCENIVYSKEWKDKLAQAFYATPEELSKLDSEYGIWLGNTVLHFIKAYQIKPDLIASHGHTIFHKPHEKYTLQIGSGKIIKDLTQIPVVNNFRTQDVAMGGQGAPLVPIGDELLFPEFDFCLNLGGFSNISWKQDRKRLACDIGPCNILMNAICKRISLEYDKDGTLASQGKTLPALLDKWNAIDFYKLSAPKSLGREWFEMNFIDDIQNDEYDIRDLMATALQHIVVQLNIFLENAIRQINSNKQKYNVLITGGGAHNAYLMNELSKHSNKCLEFVIPDRNIIDYKEAIVFALLGYLRWNHQINVLASVTGAERDHSSGEIYI